MNIGKSCIFLLIFLICGNFIFAQTTERTRHADNIERFEKLRVTSPAFVSYFDGHFIEIVEQDRTAMKYRRLEIDSSTQLPDNFAKESKDKKKLYFIVYCVEHDVVYYLERYSPIK